MQGPRVVVLRSAPTYDFCMPALPPAKLGFRVVLVRSSCRNHQYEPCMSTHLTIRPNARGWRFATHQSTVLSGILPFTACHTALLAIQDLLVMPYSTLFPSFDCHNLLKAFHAISHLDSCRAFAARTVVRHCSTAFTWICTTFALPSAGDIPLYSGLVCHVITSFWSVQLSKGLYKRSV